MIAHFRAQHVRLTFKMELSLSVEMLVKAFCYIILRARLGSSSITGRKYVARRGHEALDRSFASAHFRYCKTFY